MTDFTKGENRQQSSLFTKRLDDYIAEVSATCVVDVFIDDLDFSGLGFERWRTASTAWLQRSGPLYSAPLNMVPGRELRESGDLEASDPGIHQDLRSSK